MYVDRKKPKLELERKWPRSVRTLYSRLRTDHSRELANYRYLIEAEDEPFCTSCDEGRVENIQHVLCECSALEEIRYRVFGGPVELSQMTSNPEKCRLVLRHRFKDLYLKEEHIAGTIEEGR